MPSIAPHHPTRSFSLSLSLMRSPGYSWAAIKRVFSTSAPQNPSSKTRASLQSIQFLASASGLQDAIRSLILRRHLGCAVHPDCFAAVLKHCASPETLRSARQLHAHMIVTRFDHDPFICNHLINVYGKCGFLADADWVFRRLPRKKLHSWNILIAGYCKFGFLREGRRLFDEMPRRDSVSWNTIIAAYDQWGPCKDAIQMFVEMTCSDCQVDNFGMSSAISACANLRSVENGAALHGFSAKSGLDLLVSVGSALVELYSKCEQFDDAIMAFEQMDDKELFTWNTMLDGCIRFLSISDAINFFETMPEKNVVSWTTIVAGCSQHDRNEKAIEFFHKMLKLDFRPDYVSFVSVLDACTRLLDLTEGTKIHAKLVKNGFCADRIVGSALIAMYAKCGYLSDARIASYDLAAADDFSWSVLIAEHLKQGHFDGAHELFESLLIKSVPLWNALIGGYAAVGLCEEASAAFKRMLRDGKCGDEYTFGSLLTSGVHLGLRFGEQLQSHIIKLGVDLFSSVASALINMYSSNLNCQAAVRIFECVKLPGPIVCSSMISGYALNNLIKDAMRTFSLMIDLGSPPDNVTLSLILHSCSRVLSLHGGSQVHAFAYKLGLESDAVVGSALIVMYSKCGSIECASHAFDDIHRHTIFSWTALVSGYMKLGMFDAANKLFDMIPEHNVVSWNVMLSGYAKHGFPSEALHMYCRMGKSGLFPDQISFTTLLTVCVDSVLVESGKQVHAQVIKNGYHTNTKINFYLTCMYEKFGELCDRKKFTSGSSDSTIADASYSAEPDTIVENLKLLASVYFSHFGSRHIQNRAE